MIDSTTGRYRLISSLIDTLREKNLDWSNIELYETSNEIELQEKLNIILPMIGLNDVSVKEWKEIVENKKQEEEIGKPTKIMIPSVIIPNENDNDYVLDKSTGSAWTSYKKTLINNHFDQDAINMIETSSHRILNKLSKDTIETGPVKGLVIGNVQSGKTANMAALMAMAADQGWNLFIVLSGTIENLRNQTQERLINDLKSATNVAWTSIDNVSTSGSFVHALSKLSLGENNKQRYLMVCLKNSTRLKNLLTWLKKDLKARSKLKILFIDDEADQAGVNASKVSKNQKLDDEVKERTKINQSIAYLLTNKDAEGKEVETKFQSLNYIAYTATPYANVLNERPGPESIYPESFVSCLGVSQSYFGPQVIFGLPGHDIDGLSIINNIEEEEVSKIKKLSKGLINTLPKELEKAILWFYCCFAIRKYNKVYKPVSMLIHTSQKQTDHDEVSKAIKNWKNNISAIDFVKKCEKVYAEQTKKLTIENFKNSFVDYSGGKVNDYPLFKEISNFILEIFNNDINSIKIDEEGEFKFSKGVNLCIDNCSHSYIENGDEHIRLIYPDPKKKLDYTTGFIVVGGATLSRGLTIEGLVSTYFLRTVRQADTLMQMGRWFGYRKGYELLPRIWITEQTKKQFEFLSLLDFELRNEMKYMEENGIKPSLVGIKVRNHPKRSFLEITSKNKKKAAETVDVDFGGVATQTTVFYSNEKIIKDNYDKTIDFISSLGDEIKDHNNYYKSQNSIIWENISNDEVLNYLSTMQFPKNDSTFLEMNLFKTWYEKLIEKNQLVNWNVVVSGNESDDDSNVICVNNHKIHKVNRSKKGVDSSDGNIRIGALRSIKDYYMDINISNSNLSKDDISAIKKSNSSKYKEVRNNAGLDKTSLLIIYFIDKNSKPRKGENNRKPLDLKHDLVGLSLIIPQSNNGIETGTHVAIKIKNINSEIEYIDVADEEGSE